jgi:hypothetical protein
MDIHQPQKTSQITLRINLMIAKLPAQPNPKESMVPDLTGT